MHGKMEKILIDPMMVYIVPKTCSSDKLCKFDIAPGEQGEQFLICHRTQNSGLIVHSILL